MAGKILYISTPNYCDEKGYIVCSCQYNVIILQLELVIARHLTSEQRNAIQEEAMLLARQVHEVTDANSLKTMQFNQDMVIPFSDRKTRHKDMVLVGTFILW